LKAAQPQFLIFFQKMIFVFNNLERNDYDSRFDIQEVTTSAFVIVLVKDKAKIELDKNKTEKWLNDHCKTGHKALYFCLEDATLVVECCASKIIS
jgi:trans-2,3-dihydro-3-hydroxyanthranilate isomerase